jgi:hypothetical protein
MLVEPLVEPEEPMLVEPLVEPEEPMLVGMLVGSWVPGGVGDVVAKATMEETKCTTSQTNGLCLMGMRHKKRVSCPIPWLLRGTL